MKIRKEQSDAMLDKAEEDFVHRLVRHVREALPESQVRTPQKTATVATLPEPELEALVRFGVEKARRLGFTWESTIASFVSLMFEIAPGFSEHPAISGRLSDPEAAEQLRMDDVLTNTPDDVWDQAEAAYDPNAWVGR